MANMGTGNRWMVLTGAPCSGKTSVIEELHLRGYRIIPESARAYLEAQLALGVSPEEVFRDRLSFERRILMDKVAAEKNLDPGALIFFDRGIPDSIAYFRLSHLDTAEPLACARKSSYHTIFLLERLPTLPDAVRKEAPETARAIEQLLVESYEGLGHTLVRIPVMTVSERADAILEHLK